jgi:signal transduction histidine kinase
MMRQGRIGSFRSPTTGLAGQTASLAQVKTGLGTSIVKALAHQLGAQVETLTGPQGTTVSVTRATFSVKARVA